MIFNLDKRDLRLVFNLFKMMLRDRYLGSTLGGAWAILNPLLLLALYTFVFGFVFRTRLPGADGTFAYSLWLIAGLGPWMALTESIMAGTAAVSGNASMIKNMSFKAECLPLAAALTGCIPLLVSQVFLVFLLIADGRGLSGYLVVIPLVVVLQFVFVAGMAFFLSSLNVFFRDIVQILPSLLNVVLFTSPIMYPIDVFPARIHTLVGYSPFAIIADGYRQPFIHGSTVDVAHMAVLAVVAVLLFVSGLAFFRRLKLHFDARL